MGMGRGRRQRKREPRVGEKERLLLAWATDWLIIVCVERHVE
jgi:hypothetical protein